MTDHPYPYLVGKRAATPPGAGWALALALVDILLAVPALGFGVWLLADTAQHPGDWQELGYAIGALVTVPSALGLIAGITAVNLRRRFVAGAVAVAVLGLGLVALPAWWLFSILGAGNL